jgi:hypothetical protein
LRALTDIERADLDFAVNLVVLAVMLALSVRVVLSETRERVA